jgi:hypothetical protein
MLRFTGENPEGKRIYFVGLSRENINRLTRDEPITVLLRELGGPDATVVLCFGETEKLLFNRLKQGGLIPEGVEFREPISGQQDILVNKIGVAPAEPDPDN